MSYVHVRYRQQNRILKASFSLFFLRDSGKIQTQSLCVSEAQLVVQSPTSPQLSNLGVTGAQGLSLAHVHLYPSQTFHFQGMRHSEVSSVFTLEAVLWAAGDDKIPWVGKKKITLWYGPGVSVHTQERLVLKIFFRFLVSFFSCSGCFM